MNWSKDIMRTVNDKRRMVDGGLKKILLSLAMMFCLFFSNKTFSQVLPPNLLCVQSDTLFWELPNNPCGSFNNYSIYISSNSTGPFNLLTTISNQAQTFYADPNPSGVTWYYYMESDFNCPGEPILQSDTLDNRSPEPIIITSASVNGDNVELNWLPSVSPETVGYIIFRNTPTGTEIVDTVLNSTFYVDVSASPTIQPETYFVIAMDACGNTSIFDAPHTSIFATEIVGGCDQTITLNWNLYQNWENGIEAHEIWVGLNGNVPTLTGTVGASDTSFVFENANDSDNYCFFIKAVAAVSGFSANSNKICLTPDLTQPIRNILLKNVNVLPDNSVELTWHWDDDAEIVSVEILQSNENGNYSILNSTPVTLPLNSSSSANDAANNPALGKLFYQIQTTDLCDTLATSNYGSTIHLTGTALPNLMNQVSWTALDIEGASLLNYEVFRVVGNNITFLQSVPLGTTSITDIVDPSEDEESNVCYIIEAVASITLPNGSIDFFRSRSNLACVEQLTSIISPNAFAPNGRNQIFKPTIVFGETIESFNMKIFNRWGELVFESNNPNDGWNGKYKGKLLPMDTFVFTIRVVQTNGRVVEDRGNLVLIR